MPRDKRTPAERGRAARESAARKKASLSRAEKRAQRSDAEERFGGRASDGRTLTDAQWDDPDTAEALAEHLDRLDEVEPEVRTSDQAPKAKKPERLPIDPYPLDPKNRTPHVIDPSRAGQREGTKLPWSR